MRSGPENHLERPYSQRRTDEHCLSHDNQCGGMCPKLDRHGFMNRLN
jgi:hypothetical protein